MSTTPRPRHRAPARRARWLTRHRRTLAPVLSAVLAVTGLTVVVASPAEAGSAGWVVRCDLSHSAPDDPIVHPHHTGGAHLHDFVGNTSTNAHSTYESMLADSPRCGLPQDTAGYWTPAVYRNGVKLDPAGTVNGKSARNKIYYRANNLSSGTKVESIPADLRIVAGNGKATVAAENPKLGKEIYWGCSDNSTGKLTAPPASCSTGIISLHVGFPNCWNGVLTHLDDTANLVYPSSGKCPSSHPRPIPRVILRWEYPVGTTTGTITLASGNVYSMHGDFWNTWDQPKLDQLVADCLNRGVSCGTFSS